jgi:hypothetical protein
MQAEMEDLPGITDEVSMGEAGIRVVRFSDESVLPRLGKSLCLPISIPYG